MEVPQEAKNRTILQPSNCTTGYLSKRYRCSETMEHLHPNVHSSNVHNSQTVEGAEMSFDRRMNKEDVVYIYTQWNITQPSEKTNTHHLHLHGWNWRVLC